MMINILICLVSMAVGIYTFIRHLNAFNNGKTSAVDAWLVAVGTMAWSLALYANLYFYQYVLWSHHIITLIHAFFMIYWVGDNLKIQRHCMRHIRKIKLKKGAIK